MVKIDCKITRFKVLKFKKSDFSFQKEEIIGLPSDMSNEELIKYVNSSTDVLNPYYTVYVPMDDLDIFSPFMII